MHRSEAQVRVAEGIAPEVWLKHKIIIKVLLEPYEKRVPYCPPQLVYPHTCIDYSGVRIFYLPKDFNSVIPKSDDWSFWGSLIAPSYSYLFCQKFKYSLRAGHDGEIFTQQNANIVSVSVDGKHYTNTSEA